MPCAVRLASFVRDWWKLAAGITAVVSSLSCGGCAYSYVDDQGNVHAVGLMSIVVQPAPADGPIAGNIVSIMAVGLAAGSNAQGGYLAIGYSRQVTAALRDNVVVTGNPIAALDGVPTSH